MRTVDGKVAVVTGAASGIGQALARRFASEGARVVLADIDVERLATAARELRDAGADALGVETDVSDRAALAALAEAAVDRFGAVDIVCNNAGTVVMGDAWDIPVYAWHHLMSVNFWSVVHGIQTFVPLMLAQGTPGYVINTASMAGLTAVGGLAPYVASKQAVVGLSEVLFHDLAAIGAPIAVSVVCPGMVATRLGQPDAAVPTGDLPAGMMSADAVAAEVRSAMAEERFYVLTHPGSDRLIGKRFDAIASGGPPAGLTLPDR